MLFTSYRDGRRILLTPESTVRAQKSMGATSSFLWTVPPMERHGAPPTSVELTHRWEERSLRHLADERRRGDVCVVHGGVDMSFVHAPLNTCPNGFAGIGGSLGSCHREMIDSPFLLPQLPAQKPKHLWDRRRAVDTGCSTTSVDILTVAFRRASHAMVQS